jgi:hypothetical protein
MPFANYIMWPELMASWMRPHKPWQPPNKALQPTPLGGDKIVCILETSSILIVMSI